MIFDFDRAWWAIGADATQHVVIDPNAAELRSLCNSPLSVRDRTRELTAAHGNDLCVVCLREAAHRGYRLRS